MNSAFVGYEQLQIKEVVIHQGLRIAPSLICRIQ